MYFVYKKSEIMFTIVIIYVCCIEMPFFNYFWDVNVEVYLLKSNLYFTQNISLLLILNWFWVSAFMIISHIILILFLMWYSNQKCHLVYLYSDYCMWKTYNGISCIVYLSCISYFVLCFIYSQDCLKSSHVLCFACKSHLIF